MVEICFDVIIHGKKDHADTIAHIGLAPGTVAAAIQTMAGLPGIFLAGHLQKIAGMDRQNSGLGNLDRIQGVGQPGENRIVGLDHHRGGIVPMLTLYPLYLVLIQAELAAEPVDDPAGLLALGALDMASRPDGIQPARVGNRGIIRCGRIQRSLEIRQFDVSQACIVGKHHHLKLVLVHGIVVDLPAFGEIKDDSQLLLIPVGMPARQLYQGSLVLPPGSQIAATPSGLKGRRYWYITS